MNAVERYVYLELFSMRYKVVVTLISEGKTLGCNHSNESYRAAISCGTVYYAVNERFLAALSGL